MGRGRGWWYRTHPGPSLYGPCPLLDAGFWRSKFDPNLTQRDTFHLDEQFTVPVDMMQARSYPLRWFLLEQPEMQVTPDCPGRAWVLGDGEGSGQLWSWCVPHLPCSRVAGAGGSERSRCAPTQGFTHWAFAGCQILFQALHV